MIITVTKERTNALTSKKIPVGNIIIYYCGFSLIVPDKNDLQYIICKMSLHFKIILLNL